MYFTLYLPGKVILYLATYLIKMAMYSQFNVMFLSRRVLDKKNTLNNFIKIALIPSLLQISLITDMTFIIQYFSKQTDYSRQSCEERDGRVYDLWLTD